MYIANFYLIIRYLLFTTLILCSFGVAAKTGTKYQPKMTQKKTTSKANHHYTVRIVEDDDTALGKQLLAVRKMFDKKYRIYNIGSDGLWLGDNGKVLWDYYYPDGSQVIYIDSTEIFHSGIEISGQTLISHSPPIMSRDGTVVLYVAQSEKRKANNHAGDMIIDNEVIVKNNAIVLQLGQQISNGYTIVNLKGCNSPKLASLPVLSESALRRNPNLVF